MAGRKVTVITDADGRKIVMINDILFKGRKIDWNLVRDYLKRFVGIAMRWNRVRRRSISVENFRMNTPVQRAGSH